MMVDVKVTIRHHGATTIPAALSDDVHTGDVESIGRSDDGTDVEVVFPVLNGNVEWGASSVQLCNDCVDAQVTEFIQNVAMIPFRQQLGIIFIADWPGFGVRTHSDHGGGGIILWVVIHSDKSSWWRRCVVVRIELALAERKIVKVHGRVTVENCR